MLTAIKAISFKQMMMSSINSKISIQSRENKKAVQSSLQNTTVKEDLNRNSK
jgi:hypothetical protein